MTSHYNESSQTLDGLGAIYEEFLYSEEYHLIGKRVRLLSLIGFLSEMLNPPGSFCLVQLQCFFMVRHRFSPFTPHLFPQDWMVTFEEELNFVWRVAPRFSVAKLLFIAVSHVTLEY